MNKTILGMNLKYQKYALIASIVVFLGMILPYVQMDGQVIGGFALVAAIAKNELVHGLAVLIPTLTVVIVISVILAIVNYIRPTHIGGKLWIVVNAVQAAIYMILLFASKSILDTSGLLDGKFLVKYLGYGYWIGLVAAFVALYTSMKMGKVNPGYIILTIMSVIWLFPIVWIILTAFRKEGGYYVPYFIPKGFTLDNFINLFKPDSVIPFGKWWLNTLIVATFTCILSTIIILTTSYVLSRTRFSGRKTLMKIMLIIGMFPGFMSMIAVYNILKGIGLAQTLTALVVVSAAGAAMGYYICKGFFDTIPKSLDEAAITDGATRWQIFTRITIPLSKPVIIYTVLTSFVAPWTDYIFPSMVLGDKQNSYTVALGLKWMTDFQRIDKYYTQFAAGALLVSIPIVILFIFLQKFYVEGLSGAVKG